MSKPVSKIPNRADVCESDTWDLTPLYAADELWEDDLRWLVEEFPKVGGFRNRVGDSAESLLACLEFETSLSRVIDRLRQYAGLRVTEDSADAAALAREARLDSLLVRVGEATSFIAPEIQAIPDELFATYVASPVMAEYRTSLLKLRRMKRHILSVAEERILALGQSAVQGHGETFSQLTNVDMKFGSLLDEHGHDRELTQSSFSSFLQQRDGAVRKAAFHQFYREMGEHQFTLASSLASSVRADVFHARARHHDSAREAALFSDDVPVAVYDNLISTVRGALGPLFHYFDLRRRVLGLDAIHQYDTAVPMVENVQVDVPWDEAVERVLAAVAPLGGDYVSTLRHGLGEGRWCDRYENKGKRSGAFSYGTFTAPPYIMMNYKADVFSDIYTLAHEAGHSMHTHYARGAQSYHDYHYPIFLAEVASTFNEILLTDHLLQTTEDPRMRAFILNRQIDDLRGTLYRQTMFAEFEREIHAAEEAGEALTLERFKSIYRGLLTDYFGPHFTLDPELDWECLRIPHFYSAFYVYKYATGISAAVALATYVLETGDTSRYLAFLKSGGSRFPIETLKSAGVDMNSPEPIEATLRLFARRVAEFEQIVPSLAAK